MQVHIYRHRRNYLKSVSLEYPQVIEVCGDAGGCCHLTNVPLKRVPRGCGRCDPCTCKQEPSKVVCINCPESNTDFCCPKPDFVKMKCIHLV